MHSPVPPSSARPSSGSAPPGPYTLVGPEAPAPFAPLGQPDWQPFGAPAFGPYRGAVPTRPAAPRRATPARPAELVALVLFVALADVLIYTLGGGLSLTLFFLLAAILLVAFARRRRLSVRFVTTAGLLAAVAVGLGWDGSFGARVTATFLLIATAVSLRAKRTYLPDLLASAGMTVVGSFGALAGVARGARNLARGRDGRERPSFPLRTVVVPLGALVVFGGVFMLANPVLEAWGARLLASVTLPSPARPLFWLAALAAGAALLRPAFRRALVARLGGHEAVDTGDGCTAQSLSTARNTLVVLNTLFLAMNALDAVSLWAGQPPAGLGYTEYAHRGTVWLTFALFLSTVVLGVIFRGPFHFDPKAKLARVLAYAWAAQNAVLALGTLRRIQLYVEVSGLTSARILGIFGTTLVIVGLGLVVVMVRSRRTTGWLVHRQLDAFAVFFALFVASPTDLIATSFNVSRISDGQYAPLLHVLEKSHGAASVPALMPLLEHGDPVVRGGVAALLRQRRRELPPSLAGAVFTNPVADTLAADSLARHATQLDALASDETEAAQVVALRKLAGLANADEESFDYRGRGGVRSRTDDL